MDGSAHPDPVSLSGLDVARLFREHGAMVERVLRRAGVAEAEIADARQEVFIVVHRRLAQFEARSSVTTWLYGIAYHVACDFRRRAARRHARAGALGDEPAAQSDLARAIERRDALLRALRAIDRLAPERREVFVLHELCELPMREVAARVNCPLKTAFSRLYAARRALLAELRAAGVLALLPQPWLQFPPRGIAELLRARMHAGLHAWKAAAASASVGGRCSWPRAARVAAPPMVAVSAPPVLASPAAEPPHAAREPEMTAARVVPPAVTAPARRPRRAPARVEIALAQRESTPVAIAELAVIRDSAVDLRPVGWNPFAAEFAAPAAPLRVRVNGPIRAAASVDDAFAVRRESARDDLDFDL
jgi:RNA polymerase sigma-70 factor (ECF subfamily)